MQKLLLVLPLLSIGLARAQAPLHTLVYAAPAAGGGAVATLVYGKTDAVLVDALFTLGDARQLVTKIKGTHTALKTVYITHWHPDHYFGLNVIHEAFPQARIVARPATVAQINATVADKVKQWRAAFGENIPEHPLLPEPMAGTKLELEGNHLQVVGDLQGDCADNSYVWIPSIKTVICGDIVFNNMYPWTLETTAAQRRQWKGSLKRIEALHPAVVVAGHKDSTRPDTPLALAFTADYLTHFDAFLATSTTADELKAKIKKQYPRIAGAGFSLDYSAQAALASAGSKPTK